jgi:ketosteroid isomerase-like protein
VSIRELADAVLEAFARSDLDAAEELCTEDVVVFGTDTGEVWHDRRSLLAALAGMRDLGLEAKWLQDPVRGTHWVAGAGEFTLADGETLPFRVTMVFAGDRLIHAHYSVAVD